MGISGHVEACQKESLRAPVTCEVPGTHSEAGTRHQHKPEEGPDTEEVGEEVERLLGSDPPLHREAWHWMKGWYWAAVDRAPPPARVNLEWITAELVDLYLYILSPG